MFKITSFWRGALTGALGLFLIVAFWPFLLGIGGICLSLLLWYLAFNFFIEMAGKIWRKRKDEDADAQEVIGIYP